MNIFVCIGLNIHWAKMAPWHKGLKKIGNGVQNNTGNFEDEQVVIVFKLLCFFSPPSFFLFPLYWNFCLLKTCSLHSRYFVDNSFPNSSSPSSSYYAHVSGSRNTNLQLCAPTVVIILAVSVSCIPSSQSFLQTTAFWVLWGHFTDGKQWGVLLQYSN